jgi:hypothetical protein
MEGLGFFHVAFENSPRQWSEARSVVISVFDGSLTVPNIIAELERLIPGTWKWNVEANGKNSFKTVFPSKSELQWMVEWGWYTPNFRVLRLRSRRG